MNSEAGTPQSEPGPADELPSSIIALLRSHVSGFEDLEVLLQLVRWPGQGWSIDGLAQELRLEPSEVGMALKTMLAAGLLGESHGAYAYQPSNARLAETVQLLSRIYKSDPLKVIKAMTALSIERMRSSTLRTFSDSFRFRRPPHA